MITVDIVNNVPANSGSVYITGHGIPGDTSGAPKSLSVLGSQGSFLQAAVMISNASCNSKTVTITTSVANQIAKNDRVFVSGVGVPGYNGVFTVTKINSNTEFEYEVASKLAPTAGGAVYLPELLSSQTIMSASASVGSDIVTVSLDGPANIPLNSPIFISGLTGASLSWNGVWEVLQNSSSDSALTPNEFQIKIPSATGAAHISGNPTVDIVSLAPIDLLSLPINFDSNNHAIYLDESIAKYSAQLVAMVAPTGVPPFPLGIEANTVNLTNLGTPPFAPGQQAGNSIVDIVEFYYPGSSTGTGSTFDVSQVDGFALPLTLNASSVSSGPSWVGVNPEIATLDRRKIGAAFGKFIQNEPGDVKTIGQFGRLFYNGPVTVNPFSIASASTTGQALQGVRFVPTGANVKATATTKHGLVPGQKINISGAGTAYDGVFEVQETGLTDTSLDEKQFTFNTDAGHTHSASGTVTPTNSGVIATSSTELVVEITSGTPPASGATVQLSGVTDTTFNAPYKVVAIPANAGLSEKAVFLAPTKNQTFTPGATSGGGTLATSVFVDPPSMNYGGFYVIAAPKDWLANQSVATANSDPMASWWDKTIDAFFKKDNYLQVAIGANTNYSGKYNDGAKKFDFYAGGATTGTPVFSIAKPSTSGEQSQHLANATWVWAQADIPSNHKGTVWDQIVQAFCRGVAMDGVLTSAPKDTEVGHSNKAWTNTAKWYKGSTETSRYCPFSKFLHYSTITGDTDRTGGSSIYLQQLAYGFSEDETPLDSNGSAIATGVPSKMDGTIPDGAIVTLTVGTVGQLPTYITAQGLAVMPGGGVVLKVVITDPGSNYTSPPTITITPPENGMQATAVATIANGKVIKVDLTGGGSGYDFVPQVSFSKPLET